MPEPLKILNPAPIQHNLFGFRSKEFGYHNIKINIRLLVLLRVLININNNFKLEQFITKKKLFVWISYSLIMKQLSGVEYSNRMLARDLIELDRMDLIDRYTKTIKGRSQVYFHITKLTEKLYVYPVRAV